jgi:catechol 2,3-dioxygenase-like lactoylglutathione lyase family enzyme
VALDRATNEDLVRKRTVELGGVDERDAQLEGALDRLDTLVLVGGAVVGGHTHAAEADGDARPSILATRKNGRVALQRMDNVGIVVESLDAAISFFAELGLELEGRAVIEGDWSGRVTGLRDQRVETAMMRTPDGHGRIELSRFLAPPVVADHRNAPVNALGYLRVMFAVDDLDETLLRLRRHGAQLVDEVVQYEDVYRLCYIRGPEGILIGLAEQIG